MARPHFIYPFIHWGTFGLFPLFGNWNSAAVNQCTSIWVHAFSSLGHCYQQLNRDSILKVELLGRMNINYLPLWRIWLTFKYLVKSIAKVRFGHCGVWEFQLSISSWPSQTVHSCLKMAWHKAGTQFSLSWCFHLLHVLPLGEKMTSSSSSSCFDGNDAYEVLSLGRLQGDLGKCGWRCWERLVPSLALVCASQFWCASRPITAGIPRTGKITWKKRREESWHMHQA